MAQPTRPHLVVLTGAGISAESGIQTFRASDGLWADHPIEAVATPQAFRRDPERVLRFYDQRRDQVRHARPNAAHKALAGLEKRGFRVSIITQNIDDLHERAGSRDVLHLHGEILKARSTVDARMRYPLPRGGIALGDVCDKGSQLRPDVVWFGEAVPHFVDACDIVSDADLLLVVGTSLAVMPAASLLDHAPMDAPCVLVDPEAHALAPPGVVRLCQPAGKGVPALVRHWKREGRLWVPEVLLSEG
ncbi:SIR2 family NAD-dependent protein deacylase [Halomonas urumqiensis]|uniref:NAD-dependent protein deacylase n=1 Tax=Halomonas urumqiensis TaxID=1684789 RepID=A0A2N7UEY9_9GAMM|nr:Sir2 family NAD-dependent protein deacetylase [Halomonas urumqiensis]PMR79019.1 NAD-dependent deacylase [Halomonas urumqiensis]PTB01013.1 NAD-dependent deacylase [Halomonas urumqiensis]GHE22958.1 NAD-dependent protein deacylase [Halomonas urumqiensis]